MAHTFQGVPVGIAPAARRLRRWLAFPAAVAMLLAAASPAGANSGVAMAVDVNNAQQTLEQSDGDRCRWEVASDVTVVNLTDEPVTFSKVAFWVSWLGPEGRSGVVTEVTVVNDGGLVPGVTLAPNERRTFLDLTVQFTIPCDADQGDLAVRVTNTEGGTGSGDAPFLDDGTAVPPAAFGAAGLSAAVGAGLLLDHRRRRLRLTPSALRARSACVAAAKSGQSGENG